VRAPITVRGRGDVSLQLERDTQPTRGGGRQGLVAGPSHSEQVRLIEDVDVLQASTNQIESWFRIR